MEQHIIVDSLSQNDQKVYIIKPEGGSPGLTGLLQYLESSRNEIDKLLLEAGAIYFTGFGIRDREEFLRARDFYAGAASFNYMDGNSPRKKLTTGLYTSTEYPKEFSISLHNELSYSAKWPGTLFFYCDIPAEEGGETPIVDCRFMLKVLTPDLVERFGQHGVKYTRYLGGSKGIGKSWMDTFETQDRKVVEDYCAENNIEYAWEGNNLYLSQFGPGLATHPVTGERVWFNQANQFHPSHMQADVYKALKLMHSKNARKYPQYAFYGNGDEIPEAYLKEITDKHFEYAFKLPWKKGDILLLDNMLMAHGRMPFKGERKVYVSMC